MAQPVGSWISPRARAGAALLVVVWLVLGPAGSALAQNGDDDTDADGWVNPDGGGVGVDHGTGGGSGGSGPTTPTRPRRCTYFLQDSSTGGIVAGAQVSIAQVRAEALVDTLVWRICTWLDTSESQMPELIVVPPNPGLVARALAERASAELVLPLPTPRTNPVTQTLVNLPTWLWVEQQAVEQRSAAGGGVIATVGAQPVRTTWQPGDGTSITCEGSGVAYDVARSSDHQRSSCTHTYATRSGVLDASVTQTWRLMWTATNGEAGDLGEVSRTTDFTVDVVELDTVLRTR